MHMDALAGTNAFNKVNREHAVKMFGGVLDADV